MPPVISATLITDLLRKYLQPELGLAVQSWQCCYHQLEKRRFVQQMLPQITEKGDRREAKKKQVRKVRSHWRCSLEFELPILNWKVDKCYLWTQNLCSKCKQGPEKVWDFKKLFCDVSSESFILTHHIRSYWEGQIQIFMVRVQVRKAEGRK